MTRPASLFSLILLSLTGLSCGDDASSDPTDTVGITDTCAASTVYVGAKGIGCASSCPEGSAEAYRDGDLLVCHACQTGDDCPAEAPSCEVACGPGCEDDTGGCCGVNVCAAGAPPAPWLPDAPVEAQAFTDEPGNSEGLAFDGQGGLFVSSNRGDVVRIDADGAVEVVATILPMDGGMAGLAGVAYHPDWGVLIAQFAGRVYRFTEVDGLQLMAETEAGPNAFTFDGEGRMYVSLSTAAKILRFDAPDAAPVEVAAGIEYANGLAITPDGAALFVNSYSGKEIWRVPLDGALPAAATLFSDDPIFDGPDGLAWSPDGWLLVAVFNAGKIVALHPDSGDLRVVAEEPAAIMKGTASLAFGAGDGFDPRCVYVTNLLKGGVNTVCP
jgi:gluconolactonase